MKINLSKKDTLLFTGLVLIALILRLYFVFVIHPPEKYIFSDMAGYLERAMNFAFDGSESIYDAFYPPGTHIFYSFFLKNPYPFILINLLNVIISTVTCILIFVIATDLFGRVAGFIGLAIASLNYIFIDFAGYLMSETLFTFMLALVLFCFIRSVTSTKPKIRWLYSVSAGCAIIIAASVKSSILLFLPIFGIWWLFNLRKYKMFSNLPFYIAGFLPVFILLIIRFHSITGEFGIVSTNGGFNFFQGRSHIKDAHLIDNNRFTVYLFSSPVAIQKEYEYDDTLLAGPYDSKYFYQKGMEVAKQDLPRTLLYSLEHVADLFITVEIWPSFAIGEPFSTWIIFSNVLFFFLIIIPAFLISFVRFRFLSKGLGILVLMPIVVLLLSTMIYYGDPRFRVPFDVFFIILAGYFYSEIYTWFKNRRIQYVA